MKKGKVWIALIALLLAGVTVGAAFLLPEMQKKPVAVYPVSMVSYTGSFGTVGESSGVVTSDKVQTVYISETQTITQIHVAPGDVVKKGDLLYTYDTTLTDLVLERKELSIEQLELNLKTAREDLKKLKAMKPMVVTTPPVAEKGKSPSNAALLGTRYSGKGTKQSPYLFWMVDGAVLDQDFVWEQFLEGKNPETKIYVIFQTTEKNAPNTVFKNQFGMIFSIPKEEPPAETEPSEPTDPTQPGETQPSQPTEPSDPGAEQTGFGTLETEPNPGTEPSPITEPGDDPGTGESQPSEPTEPSQPSEPAEPERVFTISFFDPNDKEIGTQVDWNSGYTQSELTAMRNEKTQEIKDLEFSIKMAKAELAIMKKEASDGNVYASFDGIVTLVSDPSDAQSLNRPLMKISGGGGYYVEGAVSELERETLFPGMMVQVICWDTGETYTGIVHSVGAYPSDNGQGMYGSVNVTYYPYTVFVDESANLQEGAYVSLSYTSGDDRQALYLENAFVRTEGKDCFVYVRNEQGLLEKRLIQAGVSTDGYATPVYSGLTDGDFIAFPYDKNIREGAETAEAGVDSLYGY